MIAVILFRIGVLYVNRAGAGDECTIKQLVRQYRSHSTSERSASRSTVMALASDMLRIRLLRVGMVARYQPTCQPSLSCQFKMTLAPVRL